MIKYIPDSLSFFRLFSPLLLFFLISDNRFTAAFCVFVCAALSDFFDGFLARKFNVSSRFGAMLDPLADKALVIFSFLVFWLSGNISWWVSSIVIGRDICILSAVGILLLLKVNIKFRPLFISKVNTALQLIFIALILLSGWCNAVVPEVLKIFELIVVVSTIASGIAYLLTFQNFSKN